MSTSKTKPAPEAETSEPGWAKKGAFCHVDMKTPDLEAAARFYGEIFGWEFHPQGPDEAMFGTPAGRDGLCGSAVRGRPAAEATTVLYVNVADIEATLARAAERGAKTVRPK